MNNNGIFAKQTGTNFTPFQQFQKTSEKVSEISTDNSKGVDNSIATQLVQSIDDIPYQSCLRNTVNKIMESLLAKNKPGTTYYDDIVNDFIAQLTDQYIGMREFYINSNEKQIALKEIIGIFYHMGFVVQLSQRPSQTEKAFHAMITITSYTH